MYKLYLILTISIFSYQFEQITPQFNDETSYGISHTAKRNIYQQDQQKTQQKHKLAHGTSYYNGKHSKHAIKSRYRKYKHLKEKQGKSGRFVKNHRRKHNSTPTLHKHLDRHGYKNRHSHGTYNSHRRHHRHHRHRHLSKHQYHLHRTDKQRYQNVPHKSNIAIIFDIKKHNKLSIDLLEYLLHGISLRKHRIAFHSTNGVEIDLNKFQSKQCIINNINRTFHNRDYVKAKPLKTLLKYTVKDLVHLFHGDSFYVVLLTEKKLNRAERSMLKTLVHHKYNKDVYIVNIKVGKKKKYLMKQIQQMQFFNEQHNECTSSVYTDECNRVCKCVDGRLVDCYRIRKEFSNMTFQERQRYLNTFQHVAKNKKYQKVFEKYSRIHHHMFWRGIHNRTKFFPWHRRYLLGYENILRGIDCRVTIPVWDWATHKPHLWEVTDQYHMWKLHGGFGSNGIYKHGYCVEDGMFSYRNWETPLSESSRILYEYICHNNDSHCPMYISDTPFCLRRLFGFHNRTTPSRDDIEFMLKYYELEDFKKFELIVRGNWHNLFHNLVDGHMRTTYASNAPEFWSHHAMLDNLWEAWQKKGPEYLWNGYTNESMLLTPFNEKAVKYVDNNELSCGVKVRYDVFKSYHSRNTDVKDPIVTNSKRCMKEVKSFQDEIFEDTVFKVSADEKQSLIDALDEMERSKRTLR